MVCRVDKEPRSRSDIRVMDLRRLRLRIASFDGVFRENYPCAVTFLKSASQVEYIPYRIEFKSSSIENHSNLTKFPGAYARIKFS
jgi:hypothetical protein